MKKGPKRFGFDPFNAFAIEPNASRAWAASLRLASTLTPRIGFPDCRFVIPTAAACGFVDTRRSKVGLGLGLL
jgi:hypothetical protein